MSIHDPRVFQSFNDRLEVKARVRKFRRKAGLVWGLRPLRLTRPVTEFTAE